MSMGNAAKLIITVSAGIIPGEVMEERRWSLTAEDLQDPTKMIDATGEAVMQAIAWQNPHQFNWVNHEWCWL